MTNTRAPMASALLGSLLVVGAVSGSRPTPQSSAARTGQSADIPKIDFEKYTLPNGLDVILSEDHRLPLVAVNVWYHVGPANEAAGTSLRTHDVPGVEARARR